MTQIANIRRFNGTTDYLELDPVDYNGVAIGDLSWVAIAKRNGTGTFRAAVSIDGGAGGEWEFMAGGGTSTNIGIYMEPSTVSSADGLYVVGNGWYLISITKADGNTTPRFHTYRYDTTTWNHADGVSLNETATPSGARMWIGTYANAFDFLDSDLACVGVWRDVLSDAELEGMTATIASWDALSPTSVWLLNQTVVTDPVLDRFSNADEIARSGTTVVAESGLPFDVGGVDTGLAWITA